MFSCELCEISKNNFFIEHLRWLHLNTICALSILLKHFRETRNADFFHFLMVLNKVESYSIDTIRMVKSSWWIKLRGHLPYFFFFKVCKYTIKLPKNEHLLDNQTSTHESCSCMFMFMFMLSLLKPEKKTKKTKSFLRASFCYKKGMRKGEMCWSVKSYFKGKTSGLISCFNDW